MSDLNEEKIFLVGLDKSPKDVIESQEKGFTLRFLEGLEEFLELDDETIQSLSSENRTRYFVALALNRKLLKQQAEGARTPGLEVGENRGVPTGMVDSEAYKRESREMNRSGKGGSATQRLKIRLKADVARTHDVVWKRPDELQTAGYDGTTFVKADDVESCWAPPTPTDRVELKSPLTGDVELVAVKIPKQVRADLLREPGERSKKRKGNFDRLSQEEMSRDGGKVFIPGKSTDAHVGNFKKLR